jgi:hypothetical protein
LVASPRSWAYREKIAKVTEIVSSGYPSVMKVKVVIVSTIAWRGGGDIGERTRDGVLVTCQTTSQLFQIPSPVAEKIGNPGPSDSAGVCDDQLAYHGVQVTCFLPGES